MHTWRPAVLAVLMVLAGWPAPAMADAGAELDELVARVQGTVELQSRPLDDVPAPALATRVEARLAVIDETLAEAWAVPARILGDLVQHPGLARLAVDPRPGAAAIPAVGLVADERESLAELRVLVQDWIRLQAAIAELREVRDGLRGEIGLAGVTDDLGRVCPVQGPLRFSDTWGESRSWGWRTHKGVDLVADAGTPLVAIERGVVVQAGWHWAGGIGVYLLGDLTGDVFYYAHLQDIAPGIEPGAPVAAGTVVGRVGTTGNASTPHLHLGWMPGSGGVDLGELANPYELMVALCG